MKHEGKPRVNVRQDVYAELKKYAMSVGLTPSIIAETVISAYLASGKNILLEETHEQPLIQI